MQSRLIHPRRSLAPLLATATLLMATPASAGLSLTDVDRGDSPILFSTEFKVDQNLMGGQKRGFDVFLRDGETPETPASADFHWQSGTLYDWELEFTGGLASLSLGLPDSTPAWSYQDLQITNPGNWGGFVVRTSARQKTRTQDQIEQDLFEDASVHLNILKVNGEDNLGMKAFSSSLGGLDSVAVGLARPGAISSIAGTVKFSWERADNDWNTSPNSLLAVQLKAFEGPAEVPAPATSALLLAGVSLLAIRRRSHRPGRLVRVRAG